MDISQERSAFQPCFFAGPDKFFTFGGPDSSVAEIAIEHCGNYIHTHDLGVKGNIGAVAFCLGAVQLQTHVKTRIAQWVERADFGIENLYGIRIKKVFQIPFILQRKMMAAVFTNPAEFTIQVRSAETLAAVHVIVATAYGAVFVGQRACIGVPDVEFFRYARAFNGGPGFFCIRLAAYEIVSSGKGGGNSFDRTEPSPETSLIRFSICF